MRGRIRSREMQTLAAILLAVACAGCDVAAELLPPAVPEVGDLCELGT